MPPYVLSTCERISSLYWREKNFDELKKMTDLYNRKFQFEEDILEDRLITFTDLQEFVGPMLGKFQLVQTSLFWEGL